MKKLDVFLIFFLGIILFSCSKDDTTPDEQTPDPVECKTEGITYTGDIKSIFSGCASENCHGKSTSRSLANYTDAKAYSEKGRILGAIRHENGFSAMPRGGAKLSSCNIDKIATWINSDYPQ